MNVPISVEKVVRLEGVVLEGALKDMLLQYRGLIRESNIPNNVARLPDYRR